jgi:dehydrogenase/reductase SDR family protein 7B
MKNKIVWITGASSGIGEALAYQYNNAGAFLILSSRNRDELFRVKANCKSQINVHILSLDLEDKASLPQKAVEALRIYGKIDVLINCGGLSQRALALETEHAIEQRIMDINFWGTVLLSKAVLPQMLKNGSGDVVCISSLMGKFGTKYRSSYAASKHAIQGYFDSLRCEIDKPNVNILLVCPGFVKTNVTYNALTGNGEKNKQLGDAHENAMPVNECATLIIKAINEKKEEVYMGGREVKGVLFKRLFPQWFSKYIKKAKVV